MRQTRFKRVTLLTPEGIEFSFHLAGTLERFLAWLVDAAVIFAVISALGIPMAVLGTLSADIGRAAKMLGVFSISIGYRIYAEWRFGGQTIGKRLLKLRIQMGCTSASARS